MDYEHKPIDYSALIVAGALPTIFWMLALALVFAPQLKEYHVIPIAGFFGAAALGVAIFGAFRVLDRRMSRSHRVAVGLLSLYGFSPLYSAAFGL